MPADEYETLDELLIGVVRRIALAERLMIGETVLTLPESFVLRELLEHGELSQQQLAEQLWMDKSRVSRVATGLETNGWVERHRDAANRRQYKVRLTKDGSTLTTRMIRTMRRHHAELFDRMTDRDRTALQRGLQGLHRVFETDMLDALHEKPKH